MTQANHSPPGDMGTTTYRSSAADWCEYVQGYLNDLQILDAGKNVTDITRDLLKNITQCLC